MYGVESRRSNSGDAMTPATVHKPLCKSLSSGAQISYRSCMLDLENVTQISTEVARANLGSQNVVRVESEPIIDRLQEAGDDRFPIIEYATEEELADIDSP